MRYFTSCGLKVCVFKEENSERERECVCNAWKAEAELELYS